MKISKRVKKGFSFFFLFLILLIAGSIINRAIEGWMPSLRPVASESRIEKVATESRFPKIKRSLEEWRKVNLPHFPTFEFVDFCLLGDDVWAAGYRRGYGGYGRTVHSADNGKNWEVLWQDERANALSVFFFNKTNGIMVNDSAVLKTSDGGKRWDAILVVGHMPLFEILVIEDIKIRNPSQMIVRLRGGISETIETTDGGRTWEYVIYHGQHYGSRAVKLRTQNRGQTWQKVDGG